MTKEFPNNCCRCGFCCIAEVCPVGKFYFGVGENCPGLSFDDTATATCGVPTQYLRLIGVGAGCCVKARAIRNGTAHDFASLPERLKKMIVSKIRGKEVIV